MPAGFNLESRRYALSFVQRKVERRYIYGNSHFFIVGEDVWFFVYATCNLHIAATGEEKEC